MTVDLTAEQWNIDPPDCPACEAATHQEFFPPAIGGGTYGKARALAETIASEDYNVADMPTSASRGQVRYKDSTDSVLASSWGQQAQGQLAQAISLGRETRLRHGNGLDVLKGALDSGAQPDLIKESRRRSIKVY
jgi:hypothetical protein